MYFKIWNLTQWAPLILPLLGVVLGLVGYGNNHFLPVEYEFEAWLTITLVLIFNGVIVGWTIKNLARRATMDSLTGLGNKGLFYYCLQNETQKFLKKSKSSFSLAMLDIDNFKCVNDQYGHPAGDCVLKQLAQILERNVRSTDVVVRWGGEEFAIILLDTEVEGALAFLERIREITENYDFGPEVQSQKITVSVGVVSVKELDQKLEEEDVITDVVKFADQALYQAKRTRNCVIDYAQLGLT
ncbi:GGDEF domain-containing protein [Desulfitobacterium sp.]|uniref:GGDEF domain-containing protein n=1 Tax=Desulfitobacterium sp. TaxID=49981 RepID=UPI002BACC8D2|nr:GGDEF domain-containing protein [Desulfitobacterium sp.]HVJ48822.1 GGDEF domain-containing protein [Desulfitobacterium sp.]